MTIILCTTFRDFKGTDNDKIQYMFLDNIKKQTYQNFKIVTTTFGEKNVKKVVDGYFGEKSIVKNVTVPSEYRFSLTDVVLSGIEEAEKVDDKCILVWCTCDIQLEETFFQTLVNNYSDGFSGIVHPNIIYNTIDALKSKKGKVGYLDQGIDILFFDAGILIKAKQDIIDYRFYDWGVFEYFLVGIALKYSACRINIFCNTKVKKVVNDRKLTKETQEYFDRCNEMNLPILDRYVKANHLSNSMRDLILYNAHLLFTIKAKDFFYRYIKWKFEFFFTEKGARFRAKYHITRLTDYLFKDKSVNYTK